MKILIEEIESKRKEIVVSENDELFRVLRFNFAEDWRCRQGMNAVCEGAIIDLINTWPLLEERLKNPYCICSLHDDWLY